jgi:phosphopantothenoylcysteine decarboxylase/phosphopantothenate--cysteine ligase
MLSKPTWLAPQLLAGRRVVITAGPTREPIDPVRYITNRSSGKMGYAIAVAAAEAGADVLLISGPVSLDAPAGVERVMVETAEDMFRASTAAAKEADIFIGCAAVADYRPPTAALQKIKRSAQEMRLDLVRSPDTLASVAAMPDGPFTVGFAAETENVSEHARGKLDSKGVDMIAANLVGPAIGEDTKLAVARRLIVLVAERFKAASRAGGVTQAAS